VSQGLLFTIVSYAALLLLAGSLRADPEDRQPRPISLFGVVLLSPCLLHRLDAEGLVEEPKLLDLTSFQDQKRLSALTH
jgi:hypothetical protein